LSDRLVESPARLTLPKEAPSAELQRVYRLLQKDLETPNPVLEINPKHPIIQAISSLSEDDPTGSMMIEQIFINAQLMEGLPVEPSQMVDRIQQIILKALNK
jgi:molecular chaperone HtpG